jgi:hypothetical protein
MAALMREETSPQPLDDGKTFPGLKASPAPKASFTRAIISRSSSEKIQDI